MPEVAAVDREVLLHGELLVEVVLPAGSSQAGADRRPVDGRVDRRCAARRRSPARHAATIRIVEDLPAPLGPRKPKASPRRTSTSMPSTATKSPKVLVNPRALTNTSLLDASEVPTRGC
jgi:hypothetical protein